MKAIDRKFTKLGLFLTCTFLTIGTGVYLSEGNALQNKFTLERKKSLMSIVIYTTPSCPYCVRAKKLLESKGMKYDEINVAVDQEARLQMIEKAGGKTSVPQIFINDKHIGGSDDLFALDRAGKLDPLLKKNP